MHQMMKCGCAAQGVRVERDGSRIPACLTHDCVEVASEAPDLSARRARCSYHGRPFRPMGSRGGCECDTCRAGTTGRCACEQSSSPELAFFKHQPDKPFDAYYCGCSGWD